jgi:uncharacterized protein (DUF1697 family)
VPAYVALLRGIAPTNPKMRNAELRRVFEECGLDEVRTVIASGNVLFCSPDRSRVALEARLEAALADHLGAPCATIIRSRGQIARVLSSGVFAGLEDEASSRFNVTFLKRRPSAGTPTPQVGPGAEVLEVRGQEVFSVVDTGASKTPDLMAVVERTYGKEVTTRTWKTVGRIAAAFDG